MRPPGVCRILYAITRRAPEHSVNDGIRSRGRQYAGVIRLRDARHYREAMGSLVHEVLHSLLTDNRPISMLPLRSGWRATAGLCLLLAIAHTWPLATAPGTLSRNDNGDTLLN